MTLPHIVVLVTAMLGLAAVKVQTTSTLSPSLQEEAAPIRCWYTWNCTTLFLPSFMFHE